MNPKVLVIILVVIVVLFVVGVGVGLGGGAGVEIPEPPDQILQSLSPRVRPEALLPVTPGCLRNGMILLPPARACTVEIRGATWSPVRTLAVELEAGLSARLELEQKGKQEQISPKLALPDKDGNRRASLSVMREGAQLSVTCQGGPSAEACRLALVSD